MAAEKSTKTPERRRTLTVTQKATSPVSANPARSRKKPPAKASKNTAQAERARKRWAKVPAEDRSENARGMALHRWATSEHGYAEAELYFKTADLDEATESYAQVRKIYEMAGKELDVRLQAERQDQEKCSNPHCTGGPKGDAKRFDRNNPWYLRYSQKDSATGRLYNVFACSPGCAVAINAPGTKPREAPITDVRNPNFQPRPQ
jgi:hypothetical protein